MDIALVRGRNLKAYEMQTFEPLAADHRVVGFASGHPASSPEAIGFDVRQLRAPEDLLGRLPRLARLPWDGLLSKTGRNQWLFGLEDELATFDVAHTNSLTRGYTYQAVRAGQRPGGPKVVTTVWQNIPFFRPSLGPFDGGNERIRQRVLEGVDTFVAPTERSRDALVLEGVEPSRIVVQPTGIDTERFQPRDPDPALARELGVDAGAFVILFVGRLEAYKGPRTLLRALRLLLDRLDPPARDDVHLLLCGSGSQDEAVDREIERLDLSDHVTKVQGFPYDQMPDLYNLADVFTVPARPTPEVREQFGFVFLEAMASGLPIVTTGTGGIPDVVGEAAELVHPADPRSLEEALRGLYDDPERRRTLAEAARGRAGKMFDHATVARAYERIYEDALSP